MARNQLTLELEVSGRRFDDAAQGLASFSKEFTLLPKKVDNIIFEEMDRYLQHVVAALVTRHNTDWRPNRRLAAGKAGGRLAVRTGKLLRSIKKSEVKRARSDEYTGTMALPGRVGIHEMGGTVRAKRARYLTIPLPAALTSRGTLKRKNARAWKDAFVVRSRRGYLLIVRKDEDGDLVPLFLLEKNVKIPARLGALFEMTKAAPDFESRLIERIVTEALTRRR